MSDILTSLTAFAVARFRAPPDENLRGFYDSMWTPPDPVLRSAQKASLPLMVVTSEDARTLAAEMFREPDFVRLATKAGDPDPMYMFPGGGFRASPEAVLSGLLSSAALLIHLLGLPWNEGTFVRTVLENFDELRRAVRGEKVRAYLFTGFSGVALPKGARVHTPWGELFPAPAAEHNFVPIFGERRATTCLLAEQRLVTTKVDLGDEPLAEVGIEEVVNDRAEMLLPVACALSAATDPRPTAALVTWKTILLPFHQGLNYQMPVVPPGFVMPADLSGQLTALRDWCRVVDDAHCAAVDIAARRLTSAIAWRIDPADALIDAVMVWENLVGTSSETTFRVTAAIAKMLETDRGKRRELRKTLGKLYDARSKVVHGADHGSLDIHAAAKNSIEIAIRIVANAYQRGPNWLSKSSVERADIVLLEEI